MAFGKKDKKGVKDELFVCDIAKPKYGRISDYECKYKSIVKVF